MPQSQTDFNQVSPIGRNGQLGDDRPRTVETAIAKGAAGIGFGLAVIHTPGTDADGEAKLGRGTSGADNVATNFSGITVRDGTVRSGATPSVFAAGDSMPVLVEGVVFVTADGAVRQGDDVTFKETGRLGTAAVSAAIKKVPGAVWMDTAASGAVARVRLSSYRNA